MDKEAFQTDLRAELKKMPPELVPILKELAVKFGAKLEPIVMSMMASLMPHIRTIGMEMAMGALDKDEVEAMVMEVFKGEIA